MPQEKPNSTATRKPITPALSSRFRNARTPIAPRLAGSTPSSPALSTRKDNRAVPTLPADNYAVTPPNNDSTPRFGALLSRTGTDSPDTPNKLRQPSIAASAFSSPTLHSPAGVSLQSRSVAISTSNSNGRLARRISGSSVATTNDGDVSKFFYAGEIRSTTTAPLRPTMPTTKSATIPSLRAKEPQLMQGMAVPDLAESQVTPPKEEKFFRANDLSSTQTPRARPAMTKQSSSASASSYRTKSPAITRQNSTLSPRMSPQRTTNQGASRPGSPIKNFVTSSPSTTSFAASPSERRNSVGSNSAISRQSVVRAHKKAASVSTVTKANGLSQPPLARLQVLEPSSGVNAPDVQQGYPYVLASPDTISPRSASLTSSKTVETSATNDTEISDIAKIIMAVKESQIDSARDSPSMQQKAPPAPLSQAQVDAANARRERKVLDLEISNSSLLAINKTLERELRKQSAEIRRFRRLSRNGRLSFVPTNRSVSAQSMLSALSETAEEDDQEFDSSDLEEDGESQISDSSEDLSDTDSITARSRRRAREERRLMLDLSKHQQLLIDSQKLSQSIRKCVNLTEDLIKDGQKALEYKVGIGDVKLGGRVLTGDDLDTTNDNQYHVHEEQPRMGLLSPSLTKTELQEANMWLEATQGLDSDKSLTQADVAVPVEGLENLKITQDAPG